MIKNRIFLSIETMDDIITRVEKVSVYKANIPALNEVSFALAKSDHLAITGASGSGKTLLGLALAGQIFHKGIIEWAPRLAQHIVWIEQQHHFKNRFNTNDLYYQQRFNSYDSEETQTVEESLGVAGEAIQRVLQKMKIGYLRSKPLIQLSNGENKKLQIAKALLLHPAVLVMDQPFTGLDADTRKYLHQLLNELAGQGVTIIIITTPDEIPACITKVISLYQGKAGVISDRKEYLHQLSMQIGMPKPSSFDKEKLVRLSSPAPEDFQFVVRMKNIRVQYGEKKILQNVNWEVRKGERWLLSGANGAGKSTLLSLVTADNPQGYANELYLFDRRRGSGESIWDIKKKIGFLSPELHLFFHQSCNCFQAVASGLFDTIGLFRQLSQEDIDLVHEWMEVAGITSLRQKRLAELSLGEQRIVLLVRALVKNPPLLVLDEPCQGIDNEKQAELLEMINTACVAGNKTMVFVTHYANDKPACIDHLIHLEGGKIISCW